MPVDKDWISIFSFVVIVPFLTSCPKLLIIEKSSLSFKLFNFRKSEDGLG